MELDPFTGEPASYARSHGMTYVKHVPSGKRHSDIAIEVLTDLEIETLRIALDLHEEGLGDTHTHVVEDEHRLQSWEQLLETANSVQNQIAAVKTLRHKFGIESLYDGGGDKQNGD